MLTLHLTAVCAVCPMALVESVPGNSAACVVKPQKLKGAWYRVFPSSSSDVLRIQDLDHHVDKFSPAEGGGVLISARAMHSIARLCSHSHPHNVLDHGD